MTNKDVKLIKDTELKEEQPDPAAVAFIESLIKDIRSLQASGHACGHVDISQYSAASCTTPQAAQSMIQKLSAIKAEVAREVESDEEEQSVVGWVVEKARDICDMFASKHKKECAGPHISKKELGHLIAGDLPHIAKKPDNHHEQPNSSLI